MVVTATSSSAASISGSYLVTPLTSMTLNPGQYYLVQQAVGASTTAPLLPSPDATGTISMSGTAGKVALSPFSERANTICG